MSTRWTAADIKPSKAPSVPPVQRKPAPAPKEPREPGEAGKSSEMVFFGKLPGANGKDGLLRMHWSKRSQLAWRLQMEVLIARPPKMAGPVKLELIRYSTGRHMDYDGLVSTGKLPIDALVRCGILPDDNPQVITERVYTQARCRPNEQRTLIRLTQLQP